MASLQALCSICGKTETAFTIVSDKEIKLLLDSNQEVVVPTCIGYTDVKAGEPSLRSFPVLAEFLFSAHGLLHFAQPCLMLTKTIPWSIDRPI